MTCISLVARRKILLQGEIYGDRNISMYRFFLFGLMAQVGCGGLGLQQFKGDSGGADFSVEPEGEILFGSLPVNDALEQSINIIAGSKVGITNVYIDNDPSDSFSLPPNLPLPILLEEGTELPVKIVFSPTSIGAYTAWVVVEAEGDTLQQRSLQGQGCNPSDANCG